MQPTNNLCVIRFGVFEVNIKTGELRKQGARIKLQEQPFQVLALLLEKPGEIVTREEMQHRLWPEDTFVDFDHSLNKAINKIRDALCDSADNPRFIETLARRGYRFIAPVEGTTHSLVHSEVHGGSEAAKGDIESGQAAAMKATAGSPRQPVWKLLLKRRRTLALGAVIMALLLASALIWKWTVGFQSKSRAPGTPGSLAGEQPSIVVLPFNDISPGHDNEYLADGLTEEIIGRISQVRALKVISRTSAMTFKGTRKPLRTIAEEMKVRYILEGSVRRAGNNLRITAQLIDATSDTHLWAGQYPGTLDNVFDMQEKVSRAIVAGLKLRLTPVEERQIARRPITNVQAYDTYLRARNVLMQFKAGPKLDEARQLLEQSLKLNGDNAVIYAGLGYVHYEYATFGFHHEESVAKAEAYAGQALRLDPENAEALMVLGNSARPFLIIAFWESSLAAGCVPFSRPRILG
jgi:TolB-like protein/DNA-binding winged helix-turn-helix (wHTH) protein